MGSLLFSIFSNRVKPWTEFPSKLFQANTLRLVLLWIPKSGGFCFKFERSSGEFQSGLCWQLAMSILLNTWPEGSSFCLSACTPLLRVANSASQLLRGVAFKWNPGKRSKIVVTDLKSFNMNPMLLILLLACCLFELVDCCNVYADYCDLAELQLQVSLSSHVFTVYCILYQTSIIPSHLRLQSFGQLFQLWQTTFPSISGL